MKKIILKSGLTIYQRIMLILVFIFTFSIGGIMVLTLLFKILKVPEFDQEFVGNDYFYLFFFPVSLFILLIILSKNGILVTNKKDLYSAKFIFGKYWFRQKVDLSDITDISILSYKESLNFAPFSFALPEKKYEVYNNKIYLLNEYHTIKRYLISTSDMALAEKTVDEIKEVLHLNYELYNPRY